MRRLVVAPYLRTTGEPGQGVDCRLLHPVSNYPAPTRRPAGFLALVAAAAKRLRSIEGPSNPQKSEAKPVTSATPKPGRASSERLSSLPRFHVLDPTAEGSARPPRRVHGGVPWFTRPVRRWWLHIGIDNVDGLKADLHWGFAEPTGRDFTKRSASVICGCTAADQRARRSGPIRTNPDFAGAGTNHPFTMTAIPAVLSTKSFTPQVPLYH